MKVFKLNLCSLSVSEMLGRWSKEELVLLKCCGDVCSFWFVKCLTLTSVLCLFKSQIDYYFIGRDGLPEAWAVIFYIVHLWVTAGDMSFNDVPSCTLNVRHFIKHVRMLYAVMLVNICVITTIDTVINTMALTQCFDVYFQLLLCLRFHILNELIISGFSSSWCCSVVVNNIVPTICTKHVTACHCLGIPCFSHFE